MWRNLEVCICGKHVDKVPEVTFEPSELDPDIFIERRIGERRKLKRRKEVRFKL